MSNKEIERKFLVDRKHVEEITAGAEGHKDIKQSYVAVDDAREVRLRQVSGGSPTLTVKSIGGLEREEYEIELTDEQLESMRPLLNDHPLSKTRYEIPFGDYVIELDVYAGALSGLVVAEIEFDSKEEARAFERPRWLGEEVTEDARYRNRVLAGTTYDDLAAGRHPETVNASS